MEKNRSKGFLSRCYAGEERAWKVFWLVYLPCAIAFYVLFRVLVERSVSSGSTTELFIATLLYCIFGVWIVVAIWRCAHNVAWRPMFYVARMWAGIGAVSVFTTASQLLRMP